MADAYKLNGPKWQNRIVGYDNVPPDQLLANPANFRRHPKHQQDALAGVLGEVGWVQDVIVNRTTDHVVDGHLRVELALRNGEPTVPVKYIEVSEDEELEILATLDPISALATIDAPALDALLASVNTSEAAVQEMLAGLAEDAGLYQEREAVDAEPQIDRAEELRQKWGVESGDLWQLGDHRLICGDCTDAAVVARVMGGEKAQLAWFDPPFGINLEPQRGLTSAIQNDGKADAQLLWAAFLPILHANLTDPSHVFLCQGWTEFDWTLPLIREWFTLKAKVVWNKNVWGIGYYTRPKHEDIIYCWKGEPKTIDEPVADVWDVARESAPDHAAEKPPELSARAIGHFSQHGDIVADWFNGVGGSIIACEQLGRKCRAVEISPGYVAVALQRWADATGKEPARVE